MTPRTATPQQNNGADAPGPRVSHLQVERQTPVPPTTFCIFMPFAGFGPSPQNFVPQSQSEKVKTIIKNVTKQQAAVRNNIETFYEHQANFLREQARREIAMMAGDYGRHGDDPMEHMDRKRAVDALIQSCKADASVYEDRLDGYGNFVEVTPDPLPENGAVAGDGDIEMGSTDMSRNNEKFPQKKTQPITWRGTNQKLSKELQSLVEGSVKELERYDVHCKGVIASYQHALDRRRDSRQQQVTAHRIEPLLLSRSEIVADPARRLSNGMPVVGAPRERQARVYETLEGLARRGSVRE